MKKPPSQRPERKLDEVAKAIAQQQSAAKKEKTAETEKSEREKPAFARNSGNSLSSRKPAAPSASSTKRIKSGDG